MRRRDFLVGMAAACGTPAPAWASSGDDVRAPYLSIDSIYSSAKAAELERLIAETELNAIVIDYKVGKPLVVVDRERATREELRADQHLRDLVHRFKRQGVYVIGRLVTFQDTYLARLRPALALRLPNGAFWYSGKQSWQRYWVDMAAPEVLDYTVRVAKQGIDLGFDEINFDYIRFPSDGPQMKTAKGWVDVPIRYPVWDGKTPKADVLEAFFGALKTELQSYHPAAALSIDIFGSVYKNGFDAKIGQHLVKISRYFDVIAPMAYPSHYNCGEMGVADPNRHPALVYRETLGPGLEILKNAGSTAATRPWVQDFSIANIFGCGGRVEYGPAEIRAQIDAAKNLGINGFMLWNARSSYTKNGLRTKAKPSE